MVMCDMQARKHIISISREQILLLVEKMNRMGVDLLYGYIQNGKLIENSFGTKESDGDVSSSEG